MALKTLLNQSFYTEINQTEVRIMNCLNCSSREVFREAVKRSAASIICVHNHPSGDPSPSQEDIQVTKRLAECGKMIGIELLDHLVIGDQKFVSLIEKGYV